MNSYIAEESENRRFLGAILLSVLVHAALFLLLKTTGLGTGYNLVTLDQGGPISIQMGYLLSPGSEASTAESDKPAEPTDDRQEGSRDRVEISAVPSLPVPSVAARPQPGPKPETEPPPTPDREPDPEPEPEPPREPDPEPEPEPPREPDPEPEPEPPREPDPEPDPEPPREADPEPDHVPEAIDPVMEVQRQPTEDLSTTETVLTSESGVSAIPVTDTVPEQEPDQERTDREPSPDAVEVPDQKQPPIEAPAGTVEPSDVAAEPSEILADPADATGDQDSGIDGEDGEPGEDDDGSPQPAPPPPPPFGGDMLSLGGRLVYPKTAESARGGPIEYTVTYDVAVSKAGEVIDLRATESSFNREIDEQTADQLLRTSEQMVRQLVSFRPHSEDYRISVVLSFDADTGPSLRSESRIRPLGDGE